MEGLSVSLSTGGGEPQLDRYRPLLACCPGGDGRR